MKQKIKCQFEMEIDLDDELEFVCCSTPRLNEIRIAGAGVFVPTKLVFRPKKNGKQAENLDEK